MVSNVFIPALISATAQDYLISQSIRFNDDDSAYMLRTPSTAGNRKTWTFSCWFKLGDFSVAQQFLLSAYADSSNYTNISLLVDAVDVLHYSGGGVVSRQTTTAKLRDPASWYHLTVQYDSTTPDCRIWINGVEATAFDTDTNAPANTDTYVNATNVHEIGRFGAGTNYFDGLMALPTLVDGAALDYTSFAEFDGDGYYNPIEYTAATVAANQTATFENSYTNNTTTSTYTFSSCDLGAGTSSKRVIVGTSGAGTVGTETISSVTIDGITATSIIEQDSAGGGRPTGLFYADTNSTTGDVVVTFSTNCSEAGIGIWTTTTSAQLFATNSNTADNTSLDLNVPAGGFAVGYRMSAAGGATFTWTGLTEDFDEVQRASFASHTGAHKDNTSYATESISVSATTGTQHALVVASFMPTGTNINGFLIDGADSSALGKDQATTATWTASTSGAWSGDTGSFSHTGNDITSTTGDEYIYTTTAFDANNFPIEIEYSPGGTLDNADSCSGLFDTLESGTLDSNPAAGNLDAMTESWSFRHSDGRINYGGVSQGTHSVTSGDIVKWRIEADGTIRLFTTTSGWKTLAQSMSGIDFHFLHASSNSGRPINDVRWIDSATGVIGNDYSTSGLATNDQLSDTPTDSSEDGHGNFATLDPYRKSAALTLSEGNTRVQASAGNEYAYADRAIFEKVYWEVQFKYTNQRAGLATLGTPTIDTDAISYMYYGLSGDKTNTTDTAYTSAISTDQWCGFSYDPSNGDFIAYPNGSSGGTMFTLSTASDWYPMVHFGNSLGDAVFNFGQVAFAHTVPTGFVALATQDLGSGDPLYTGNASQLRAGIEIQTNAALGANTSGAETNTCQRQEVDASVMADVDANWIRVKFQAHTSEGWKMDQAYVGEKAGSGNAWDFDGNQVQLTFNGATSVTVPAGTGLWSDWVALSTTGSINKIVSCNVGSDTANDAMARESGPSGYTRHAKNSSDEAGDTAPSGFTSNSTNLGFVKAIEVQ